MREFSHFNQILLSLFDVLNVFHDKHWNRNVSICVYNSNAIMNCHLKR